ncbi:unnamed protein product, partial [Prorocentrum cordatum]
EDSRRESGDGPRRDGGPVQCPRQVPLHHEESEHGQRRRAGRRDRCVAACHKEVDRRRRGRRRRDSGAPDCHAGAAARPAAHGDAAPRAEVLGPVLEAARRRACRSKAALKADEWLGQVDTRSILWRTLRVRAPRRRLPRAPPGATAPARGGPVQKAAAQRGLPQRLAAV